MAERLSLIASEDALASVGARVEDLVDPDVRAVVIRADHPELDQALREDKPELIVDGKPMSIRLHLTMHQVLAARLADDDPPQPGAWERRRDHRALKRDDPRGTHTTRRRRRP